MNQKPQIAFFEKYLTVWVLLCIVLGVTIGYFAKGSMEVMNTWNIASINIPIAILVWLMIYPMMVQIDFSSLKDVGNSWKGLGLTVGMNWLVKPFTMAFICYVFFHIVFKNFIPTHLANDYLAGAILLGAAPCTAMVFVWSYLTRGDANYTLVQVSINDIILLFAFIPIVAFLLSICGFTFTDESGTQLGIPYDVLLSSVVIFVVIPLLTGYLTNRILIKSKGEIWFREVFLKRLKPISIFALLTTLVLIFAFQGEKIVEQPLAILLIAIPLAIQTYLIFFVTWGLGKLIKLPHAICAPAAMIGASNFFELAVAVAISLFGINSGASLATVVGVLIEVPIMLSLVRVANKWVY